MSLREYKTDESSLLFNKNKHPFDSRITFQESGHIYYIDGVNKDLISCTTFIHKFFNSFDSDTIINNILNSSNYLLNPEYKYFGMSYDQIKDEWTNKAKEAAESGTNLHLDIEHYYNNLPVSNNSIEFSYFLNFFNDHKHQFQIFRTEWMIFTELLKITGSIDAVFINDDGTLSLGDWKRTKEIKYVGFNDEKGIYPFDELNDCNYCQYSLQLNLYRIILEKFYNFKVKEMFLVVLHPDNKNYKKIMVTRMEKEAEWLLDFRRKELAELGYTNISIDLSHTIEKNIKELDMFKNKNEKYKRLLSKNNKMNKLNNSTSSKHVHKKLLIPSSISKNNDIVLTKHGLSEKQQIVYDLISKGQNVFMTGLAGSGKTHLIKKIYSDFYRCSNIGVTSTTGTSAILINGSTLHSFLGIGLGQSNVESLFFKIKKNSRVYKKWRELDLLIIDEVSMLSPALFDKLENLARLIRKNDDPFGGIQLLLSGDFLQLPVVGEYDSFCFDAESWKTCINNIVYLDQNFRQSDSVFQKCLNEIRLGTISDETKKVLESRVNATLHNDLGILPTKIYSLNRDVDSENESELYKLLESKDDLQFFQYDLEYEVLKKGLKNVDEKIKKACNAPFSIQLCVGAQVMLLYNMDIALKLVNGSRGVVVGFEGDFPKVKFLNGVEMVIDYKVWTLEENDEVILQWKQVPLRVAFAISSHKSQGITIDYAIVDLSNIFENSQAYVALSRVKSLEGLSLRNLNILSIKSHPRAIEFYSKLQ